MTSQYFTYNKGKVIQALRYHFITRREIKLMLIVVNVFAILSAGLFFFREISPLAFLVSAFLWFVMMIAVWFVMPTLIYKRSVTFKDRLRASFTASHFIIENEKSSRSWPWEEIATKMESPHFFHIYFGPRSFFIVPKEAFEGDEVHDARKLLNEKVKG
jgi:hypothetical protein